MVDKNLTWKNKKNEDILLEKSDEDIDCPICIIGLLSENQDESLNCSRVIVGGQGADSQGQAPPYASYIYIYDSRWYYERDN